MESLNKKKLAILISGALFVACYIFFDLGQYINLSYIKASQERFRSLYVQHPIGVIALYMVIYVIVTALSLPGAVVMTLAGGALFGLLAGTVIVSFASTIGATISCIVSRYLLREWVRARFGPRLDRILSGFQTEGAFYLFTLRLIPLFPFFLINLVMGLSKIRLSTFYWVSQMGMLPGTIVYVNAGRELGRIETVSGVLSPELIISFALLGIFPITAKKAIELYKKRRTAGRKTK
jgi:uncharacterized membrane protein YdjX (TVP38/TMEM64 family)